MMKARFLLPACEDDLWREVVRALLLQRNADEERARDHLRLLEELAFHSRFCGQLLTRAFAEDTSTWLVEERKFGSPRDRAQQWLADLERWELLLRGVNGKEATYEFTIPTLDEYFAARHLAARWNDRRYRDWLPSADRWWERTAASQCPNPECGALLPPFRDLLMQSEYEETLLLLVGLLREAEREERYLAGLLRDEEWEKHFLAGMRGKLNLTLKALGRCRHGHDGLTAKVVDRLVRDWLAPRQCAGGLEVVGRARVEAVRLGIVTQLMAALHRPEPDALPAAVNALGWFGSEAVGRLIAALRDTDHEVRWRAACALGLIGDPRAVEPLIAAFLNPALCIQRHAARALGWIGDARAVEPLMATLRGPDHSLRCYASYALGDIGCKAVGPLFAALRDQDYDIRWQAALAMVEIGREAVEPLIAALSDPDREVRSEAVNALACIKDGRAAEPLIAVLRDPDGETRLVATFGLVRIGREAVGPLIAALGDQDPDVRWQAAEVLGQIGDGRTVAPLRNLLRDGDALVRTAAQDALDSISRHTNPAS
jgi:HEAT repeat protein